jgi:hypothetical protein
MRVTLVAAATLCIGVAGCGGGTTSSSAASPLAAAASPTTLSSAAPASPTSPTASPSRRKAACPVVDESAFDAGQLVPAVANIFGAGHEQAPMPGGGGPGQLPPIWLLPRGTTTTTFACVEGIVNPIRSEAPWNGPEGNKIGPTRISSLQGISGILDGHNAMFLTGVFLTDEEPADPAPAVLDFTDAESFEELAPLVGQTFYIGDGVGRQYRVPAGATRLFVGFADAFYYVGEPGWYGNNVGQIEVTVEAKTD